MHKKTNIFLSLVFTALLFTKCKKISAPNPESNALFGEWKMVSSCGFDTGWKNESTTNERSAEFKKNGKYIETIGKEKTHHRTFKFEEDKNSFYGNRIALLIKHNLYLYRSFKISNDTLYIADEARDASSYIYVRVN